MLDIKYRVWDIEKQKFIFPVIDISNNFYTQYPRDKFIFDRLIHVLNDGTELYENDIVSATWTYTGKPSIKKDYLAVVIRYDYLSRFDEYFYRWRNCQLSIYGTPLHKYRSHFGDHITTSVKMGNIHQNFALLETTHEQYFTNAQYKNKTTF